MTKPDYKRKSNYVSVAASWRGVIFLIEPDHRPILDAPNLADESLATVVVHGKCRLILVWHLGSLRWTINDRPFCFVISVGLRCFD